MHAAVRFLDQLDDVRLTAAAGSRFLERARGECRRDLACTRASHAVRDREERRPADIRVLVATPLPPRVGPGCIAPQLQGSNLRSVSPMRTTSPGTSRRSRVNRIPFTKVPFVEPMSSIQTPSRRGSSRAWRVDEYSSSGSDTSFVAPRPIVIGCESSADAVTLVERGALQDDQPPGLTGGGLGQQPGCSGLLRGEDHRLLGQAQVARRGANDAPDEQIEEYEKGDLQGEQRRLDLGGGKHRYCSSRANSSSVEPIVNRVPSSSFSRLTRLPFTSTPFVESRSTIQYVAPSWRNSACRRETFGSAT